LVFYHSDQESKNKNNIILDCYQKTLDMYSVSLIQLELYQDINKRNCINILHQGMSDGALKLFSKDYNNEIHSFIEQIINNEIKPLSHDEAWKEYDKKQQQKEEKRKIKEIENAINLLKTNGYEIRIKE
jgi:hypothetical protein